MLKMGFKDDVDKILKYIRSKSNSVHQTLLFSATLPEWIMNLSKNYLKPDHKVVNMIPDT
jgi:superfamily II DNA/RNA helicase